MGLMQGSSSSEIRRSRMGEDRNTPRQGLRQAAVPSQAPVPTEAETIAQARQLAVQVAGLFPHDFNRALPRGYTVCSGALVILKVEMEAGSHHHLYGAHNNWGPQEAAAFIKDVREGWLAELGAFMRWQLRGEIEACMRFQTGLLEIRETLER